MILEGILVYRKVLEFFLEIFVFLDEVEVKGSCWVGFRELEGFM